MANDHGQHRTEGPEPLQYRSVLANRMTPKFLIEPTGMSEHLWADLGSAKSHCLAMTANTHNPIGIAGPAKMNEFQLSKKG